MSDRDQVETICDLCAHRRREGLCALYGDSERGRRRQQHMIAKGRCRHLSSNLGGGGPAVIGRPVASDTFVRITDLVRDATLLLDSLSDCDAIVGVARSGIIPASVIACLLHVPLYVGSGSQIVWAGTGTRSARLGDRPPGKVAIVDDTSVSARSILKTAIRARRTWPSAKIVTAAVYSHAPIVDFSARHYPLPHWLEWHVLNSPIMSHAAVDIDGVLCDYGVLLQRPRYRPARLILSARGEAAREDTERWLCERGITYRELVLSPRFLDGKYAAEWKAETLQRFVRSNEINIMIESETDQAKIIHDRIGIIVIAYRDAKVFA